MYLYLGYYCLNSIKTICIKHTSNTLKYVQNLEYVDLKYLHADSVIFGTSISFLL